jgi:histidyl-tRNA synthetase
VIGSDSLLNEVELTMIYAEAFEKLGINVTLRVNSRKLIDEILTLAGIVEDKAKVITVIDKWDKIEWEGDNGIKQQLRSILNEDQVHKLYRYLTKLNYLQLREIGVKEGAAKEVETVMSFFDKTPAVFFDPTLMRGLDYYTGVIWEVVLDRKAISNDKIQMGSLGGGGRYDNLTEMFGAKNMTGVGISFGIERIYDVMEELNLFPPAISQGVKVLFVPREPEMETFAFQQAQAVRNAGIGAEVYLGNVKKQKHFSYVDGKQIRYMVEVGSNEQNTGQFRLRNVQTRETQGDLSLADIIRLLQG